MEILDPHLTMDTFTIRDLRDHAGALIHDAEMGSLSPDQTDTHSVLVLTIPECVS